MEDHLNLLPSTNLAMWINSNAANRFDKTPPFLEVTNVRSLESAHIVWVCKEEK